MSTIRYFLMVFDQPNEAYSYSIVPSLARLSAERVN
jgi:hypothetical protein